MTVNGQIVGQGQSANAGSQSLPGQVANSGAVQSFATEQLNQAIGQLSQGLIAGMMQDPDATPEVPALPKVAQTSAFAQDSGDQDSGARAVPEVPSGPPQPSNVADGPPIDANAPDQLQQNVANSTDGAITQYQQNSSQFIDDVNGAIDAYDQVQEIKDAVDAYKDGNFDNHVVQNFAAGAYQGITEKAIDAAIPKNGDPAQDSLNDFSQLLNRLSQTPPTLSGAIDRVKDVFKTMTGNAKANLECLQSMIKDETTDCTNK